MPYRFEHNRNVLVIMFEWGGSIRNQLERAPFWVVIGALALVFAGFGVTLLNWDTGGATTAAIWVFLMAFALLVYCPVHYYRKKKKRQKRRRNEKHHLFENGESDPSFRLTGLNKINEKPRT